MICVILWILSPLACVVGPRNDVSPIVIAAFDRDIIFSNAVSYDHWASLLPEAAATGLLGCWGFPPGNVFAGILALLVSVFDAGMLATPLPSFSLSGCPPCLRHPSWPWARPAARPAARHLRLGRRIISGPFSVCRYFVPRRNTLRLSTRF